MLRSWGEVVEILKVFNRGFRNVFREVWITGDRLVSDGGYLVAVFDEGLKEIGEGMLAMDLEVFGRVCEGDVMVKEDRVVFDMGDYEVEVDLRGELIDVSGMEEDYGDEVYDLREFMCNGFNLVPLLESVESSVESCFIGCGKVVMVSPYWVMRGRVRYSGDFIEMSKGVVVIAEELMDYCKGVRLGNDGCEPTYKELKPCSRSNDYAFNILVASLPIRN